MQLRVNICKVCNQDGFGESEYVHIMNMCEKCFVTYHNDMLNMIEDLQQKEKQLEALEKLTNVFSQVNTKENIPQEMQEEIHIKAKELLRDIKYKI